MSEQEEQAPKIEDMSQEERRKILEDQFEKEMPEITTLPYPAENDQEVQYKYPELTADCPMTGIQDTYTVKIKYVPDEKVPELKDLKFYLLGFEGMRISHELLQAKIYKEFNEAVEPKELEVVLDTHPRGGIKTDVVFSSRMEDDEYDPFSVEAGERDPGSGA